jgi:CRP/FNR family transcriptional regulator
MLDRNLVDSAREAFELFERLEPETLHQLMNSSLEVRLPAGEVMFRPGDSCEGFGFVVDGSIKVCLSSEGGRELVLYRVTRGESCTVTVSCLISNTSYPATGVVEEPLTAIAIPKAVFHRQLEESRVFRSFVLEIFSSKVGHLMELVCEVAFNKLDQRLATRLLDLGPVVTMSHQELAGELGTSREIISRILESFADEGAVSLGRRRIAVERPDLLENRRG